MRTRLFARLRAFALLAGFALAEVAFAGIPNLKLTGVNVEEVAVSSEPGSDREDCSRRFVTIPRPDKRALEVWMEGRWGRFSEEEAVLMPAIYGDAGLREPMVGIALSGVGAQQKYRNEAWRILGGYVDDPGILLLEREDFIRALDEIDDLHPDDRRRLLEIHNPAGWNEYGIGVRERGWEALDPLMDRLGALDPPIRVVWFWGWAGYDHEPITPPGAHANPMGWPSLRFTDEQYENSWNDWRRKWEARGFRFGVWASTVSYPNTGTLADPIRKWPRWKNADGTLYEMDPDDPDAAPDLDWIVSELKPLATRMGFEFIGLDAVNHLLSKRDEPYPGAFRHENPSGPREPGITLALQRKLVEEIPQAQFVTEGHFPPTEHHALMPTMFIVQGEEYKGGGQAIMDEIGPEQHRHIIPGCEVIAHCIGQAWTDEEWPPGAWPGPVMTRLRELGYTPTINIFALEDRVLKPRRLEERRGKRRGGSRR